MFNSTQLQPKRLFFQIPTPKPVRVWVDEAVGRFGAGLASQRSRWAAFQAISTDHRHTVSGKDIGKVADLKRMENISGVVAGRWVTYRIVHDLHWVMFTLARNKWIWSKVSRRVALNLLMFGKLPPIGRPALSHYGENPLIDQFDPFSVNIIIKRRLY